MRFMGDAAAFAYLSMEQAVADSGLTEDRGIWLAQVSLRVQVVLHL